MISWLKKLFKKEVEINWSHKKVEVCFNCNNFYIKETGEVSGGRGKAGSPICKKNYRYTFMYKPIEELNCEYFKEKVKEE